MNLSKHKRIKTIHAIENTLENYCRVCPEHSTNQTSPVCQQCPINFQLREYGEILSPSINKPDINVQKSSGSGRGIYKKRWTKEETQILIDMRGHYTIKEIAFKLNRSYGSVRGKMEKLQ